MQQRLDFVSDTVSGVCPEAMEMLITANGIDTLPSYGEDEVSEEAAKSIEVALGRRCKVFFVTSSTAANAIALSLMVDPTQGIICHPCSHVELDEANAPELFTGGAKLLHADGHSAKIDPLNIARLFELRRGYHSAEIAALSLTQSTEVGTVYSMEELERIIALKSEYPSLKIHVDGARFANAVAAMGASAAVMLRGVDILTLGGSKNGGPPSEAIVCFDPEIVESAKQQERIKRKIKRAGQLVAKARYLSAPWIAMMQNGVWLKNAGNANARASQLAAGFEALGIKTAVPAETNQVFALLPQELAERLQGLGWHFYFFASVRAYRFVCSWNTPAEAVDELLSACSN